jgi:hypothetical protein
VLDLRPGKPVKERDISGALARLEKLSGGAFVSTATPPYTIQPDPEGAKLTLHLRRRAARLQLRPGGPATASLYNRVDGLNLGATARATLFDPVSFDHAEAYGQVAYGFSSHKARYAVGALKPFGPDRQFAVGYEYHDLTDNDDAFRRRTVDDIPGSWRSDDYRSLPVTADNQILFSDKRTLNPPVTEGRMRSILGVARWAWKRDLFSSWPEERESFLLRNPYGTPFERDQQARVEASLEVASPGLGGDFDFRRFIGHARAARVFSPRQALLVRGLFGVGSGQLPVQRRFYLGGMGTLRGYSLKRFGGDHVVLTTAEYWLYPRSPWPGLVFFYDGGTAWDRGVPRPGWKQDVGAGIDWPGGGKGYLRLDVGFPLDREPTSRRAYVTGLIRFPF